MEENLGKSSEEQYVCGECFGDTALKAFVAANAEAHECSFCYNKCDHPIAAPLESVAEHLNSCLYREYENAANELPWVGAEGGYLGKQWDTYDLLVEEVELDLPRDREGNLFHQLVSRIDDNVWCEANGIGPNDEEVAELSWEKFSETVTHERRFFFMSSRREPLDFQVLSPAETLNTILGFAQETGLVQYLQQGTLLYRVRFEMPDSCLNTVSQLGPPPKEAATQSNRMSPAGVVMFYAAEDAGTAMLETAKHSGRFVVGEFEILRPAKVLNLTSIPELPSLFQAVPGIASKRRMLKFLRHVAEQIAKPISRDGREHIEYVPTQVVTEFVRAQMSSTDSPIDGILYKSSQNPGHTSVVFFATQANLVDGSASAVGEERWLKLVNVNHVDYDHDTHSWINIPGVP